MKCPNCGALNDSKVVTTRQVRMSTKRFRTCLSCDHHFITYEVDVDDFEYYMKMRTKDKFKQSVSAR